MNAVRGLAGVFSFIAIIENLIRLFFYLSVIILSFKAVQALNIYINKNS